MTGVVELTVGDRLAGRGPDFLQSRQRQLYMEEKLMVTTINNK